MQLMSQNDIGLFLFAVTGSVFTLKKKYITFAERRHISSMRMRSEKITYYSEGHSRDLGAKL